MKFQTSTQLRARFARELSRMYGEEVPAYTTLVDVAAEVNEDVMRRRGESGERLGSIERVTEERHGAIRVGSPKEMAQVARVFAAFGMHPVGFYDLRDASTSSVPVVSTAFRPLDREELATNPFRVFTSMLTADDPRFFDADLRRELQEFIDARTLFSPELLTVADEATRAGGLPESDADRLVQLATETFKLSSEPVDHVWYRRLERVSAVAADIGGVASTHINHLTPRVLDIDDLYGRMQDHGIVMIDEIQGPPRWDGPDVLLRQTSFRALAEARTFHWEDGTIAPSELRVRFGEVEQRGIALTPAGRELYDDMVAKVDQRVAAGEGTRAEVARTVWGEQMPRTETELAQQGLAYFTFVADEEAWDEQRSRFPNPQVSIHDLIAAGVALPQPIVYEDFLPRSAAGIFQSNLTDRGSRDEQQTGVTYDLEAMSTIVGRKVADPNDLYQQQQDDSLTALSRQLGKTITR